VRIHRSRPFLALVVLLTLALASPLAPVAALARQATPVASPTAEGVVADPGGRFTVPVPTNWTAETENGYVVMRDPDGELTVYAIAVEAADPKTGIAKAWAAVDPSFDPENQPGAVEQEVPSLPGVEKTLVVTYDLGQVSGRVRQAVGQLKEGTVYALLFEGALDAATRRSSQLQIIASGFAITGVAETELTGVAPKRFAGAVVDQFEAYVADLMARTKVPGASVAVVQDGKVVFAKGFGVKEQGGSEPVTPDTLMMIGSTTKSMTTMMMATEVDDGLMRWDEPVVDILPSFAVADPALSKTITVRNLVCACTGVPRRDLELVFNASSLTPEQVIESLKGFQFYTKVGEAFQYSNQMVATGGYVAAAAAGGTYGHLGEAYADQLRRRVLDPNGMTRTTLSAAAAEKDGDYAVPHGLRLDYSYVPIPVSEEQFAESVAPAGAIWSSADEMARYVITELNGGVAPDGTRVVSQANLAETWKPQIAVDAETSYGLGWLIGEYKGLKLIGHGGNTFGFSSDLAFLPDAGIGVVVLANAQGSNVFTGAVVDRLFELLYGQPMENDKVVAYALDQVQEAKARVEAQVAGRADAAAVAPYLGRYANEALGEIDLSFVDGRLILDAGEFAGELRPVKKQVAGLPNYAMYDPPLANLLLDLHENQDHQPEVTLTSGTDRYVFTLVEKATPLP
jgi:CubicO group peptidase (beta-lactamase class C family)